MNRPSPAEIEGWLIRWFQNSKPGVDVEPGANYFDAGLVDSYGVIMLIAEIEEKYGLQFDEKNFQERRFATIEGLASIVAELATRS